MEIDHTASLQSEQHSPRYQIMSVTEQTLDPAQLNHTTTSPDNNSDHLQQDWDVAQRRKKQLVNVKQLMAQSQSIIIGAKSELHQIQIQLLDSKNRAKQMVRNQRVELIKEIDRLCANAIQQVDQ